MRSLSVVSVLVFACWTPTPCLAQMKSKISLNGAWELTNQNGSITVNGSVPGSVYTDLIHAGILADPYYRFNDVAYRWVSYDNWTYTRSFDVSADVLAMTHVKLLCGGLDTVATVLINNKIVGKTNNMFIRYVFDIKQNLQQGTNTITVAFTSAVAYAAHQAKMYPYSVPPECPVPVQNGECHPNFIRKEAASFSWDWGPAFPTQGIWRNITLDVYNAASIRYVLPETHNVGGAPQWRLSLRVIFDVSRMQTGTVTVSIPELKVSSTEKITLTETANTYSTNITIKNPALWWPNGYGGQKLYNAVITFTSGSDICKGKTRFGFRTVELVQDPLQGQAGLSFYFRINGVPIFMMGSNWIPADSFQERISTEYLWRLLGSAADANMNMLRVWGGGIYEQEALYEIADELGIMIWQDFMFACSLYPTNQDFLSNVAVEVTHQVRRLMRHPSIAVWAGNNENEAALVQDWYHTRQNFSLYRADYVKLYVDTIRTIVIREDSSRPFVSSSPSNGIKTEQQGWVAKNPQDTHYGDVHHYDYFGNSWNYSIYPVTRFTSEYGIQSWSSFETLAKISIKEDWSMDSDFANHRQHHGNGNNELKAEVQMNLNPPTSADPTENFKHWIYLTQINQAMGIKTESELLRRSQSAISYPAGEGATMGALYWQLNDIWQAPTWASTEYGGKWKMLHYYAKRFFNTTLLSAYLENNRVKASLVYNGPVHTEFQQVDAESSFYQNLNPILTIDCYSWKSLTPLKTFRQGFTMQSKAAYTILDADLSSMMTAAGCSCHQECFFHMYLNNDMSGPHSTLLLSNFIQAQGLQNPHLKIKSVTKMSNRTFSVSLQTSAVSPFVWLEATGISGRFSDNGFMMLQANHQVEFYAWQDASLSEVTASLTAMSLMDVYQ